MILNKLLNKIFFPIFSVSLFFMFMSCQPEVNVITTEVYVPLEDTAKTCQIYYYSNFNAPAAKTVPIGYRLSKKDLPDLQFNNFKFVEWYWYTGDDYEKSTPVEGTVINKNVILFAKWEVAGVTAKPSFEITSNGTENLITLKCETSNAEIYYTIDGSNPTTSSTKYEEPFVPNMPYSKNKTTVKAIAAANGYQPSSINETEYSRYKNYYKLSYNVNNENVKYTLDEKYVLDGYELKDTDLTIFRDPTEKKYQEGWSKNAGAKITSDTELTGVWKDTTPCTAPTYIREKNNVTLSCTDTLATLYYTIDGTEPMYDDEFNPIGNTKIYNNEQPIEITDKINLRVKSSNIPKYTDTEKQFGTFKRNLEYKRPYFGVIKNNQFEVVEGNEADYGQSSSKPIFISAGGDVSTSRESYNIYLVYSIDALISKDLTGAKKVLINELLDSTEAKNIDGICSFEKKATCDRYPESSRNGILLNMNIQNTSTVYYGLLFESKSDGSYESPQIHKLKINIAKYKIHYDLSNFTDSEKAKFNLTDKEVEPWYVLTSDDLPSVDCEAFGSWNHSVGNLVDVENYVITAIRKPFYQDITFRIVDIGGKEIKAATTEITYRTWKDVYDRASEKGYTFANAGTHGTSTDSYDTLPIANVSWFDAVVWCNLLSELNNLAPVYVDKNGNTIKSSPSDVSSLAEDYVIKFKSDANGIRLPTKTEWDALAGSKVWSGTSVRSELKEYATYSSTKPIGVGLKKPNENGLYDMTGNVWEYVNSDSNAYKKGENVYVLGGGYKNTPDQCKLGLYSINYPTDKYESIGFRVVAY